MSQTARKPQLQMIFPEALLESAPPVVLPEGYSLRTFQPPDAAEFVELMRLAGFENWNAETLAGARAKALPDGIFLAVCDATGALAATAMGTHNPKELHPSGAELGWVAANPDHRGKGLGMAVTVAATRRCIDAGYRRIYLLTDDWRLPAIKTYLKLGYVPLLFAPGIEDRWRAVCLELDWPFTPDSWPRAEARPTVTPGRDERPDADRLERYAERRKWLPGRLHRGYAGPGDVDAFGDESLYKPSLLGTAEARPSSVVAGQESPLRLVYTAGPAGLAAGAAVTFVMRGQGPLGSGLKEFDVAGPPGCAFEARRWGFVLKEGALTEGQSVTLTAGAFAWTPLAGRREFKVVLRLGDGRAEQRLPEPVVINVLPRPAERLDVILPCTHRPSEGLDACVTVRDRYDNRVPLSETVRIEDAGATAPMAGGRSTVTLAPGEAVRRVTATIESPALAGASNPSVSCDDYQLYVGDLHCHDFLSEAEGYPDEIYRWAMEDKRLDFVSVVPQTHGWHDNETWTVCKYMNERFCDEGRFVTFLGFEWQHTGYGDKVIHFLGGDQPYLPVDDPRYSAPDKLYQALRQSDALVIGHHPAYPAGSWCSSTDFAALETDVERLVELWSMHGSSEGYDAADRPLRSSDPARTVLAALRKGLRLGFVAGSDTHSARPGGSAKEPRPHWGGLAAVWAKDLTRRGIFEALRARRTCALLRARIVLKMTVNGAWMGAELPMADTAQIRVEAWAPGRIRKVEILKNARLIQTFGPFADECRVELEDATGGPAFYHCRVTQFDGEPAVCSPVWIG